jgi:hypothetical protein
MKKSKFIKTYEEAFTSFFKNESIILKTNPDIFEFAIRYSVFRFGLANSCTQIELEELSKKETSDDEFFNDVTVMDEESELLENHMKRFEIPELVFFGLRNKVKLTHAFLTDKRAFWALFGYLYTYIEFPSFMSSELQASCLEQDRLTVNLSERNRCVSIFQLTSELFNSNMNEYINNHFLVKNRPIFEAVASDMIANKVMHRLDGKMVSSRKFCNQLARDISYKTTSKLKSLVDSNGNLTIYRGFDIDRSENVRLSRVKKNNPFSHIQQSGVGMSFTPVKEGAIVYSLSKFKDTLTLSNNERVFNKSSFKFDFLEINKDDFLDTTTKIPVIGKYSAKKKDILFSHIDLYGSDTDLHSSEIVFFPESVKLIDYRILNSSTPVKIFDKVA